MKKLLYLLAGIVAIAATYFDAFDLFGGIAMAIVPAVAFVEKSAEELEALKGDELAAYYIQKLNSEKASLEARIKSLEDSDGNDVTKLTAEVAELKDQNLKTLQLALEEQGKVLAEMKAGNVSVQDFKTLDASVMFALKENAEALTLHAKNDTKESLKFHIKAAGDMTLAGNVSGGTVPQPLRLDGVNDIAERRTFTVDLCTNLTTDRNSIEWVYETAQDGTIDGTAEGLVKDQIDNDFVVDNVAFKKRAAYFKLSTEMLDDPTFMSGWIRNKLFIRLFLDVDNQILNGDNTGQNFNGIVTLATAFAAGTFALTVDNANQVDVLTVAANQIKIANQLVGNLVIQMNPSDVTALKLIKMTATDKRYIDRLIMVAGSLSLDGIRIIENNNVTAGDYIIGDFSKAIVANKGAISIEVGLSGTDFIDNLRTILAEYRGNVIIEQNDRTAFVTGTFSTDQTALETT